MQITPDTVREDVRRLIRPLLTGDHVMVGLLRYGAHLPHVYQATYPISSDQKIRLLLSHMLRFFSPEYFSGKRFVILDDTMYRGASMEAARNSLLACGVPAEAISRAAVVVHENCEIKPDFNDIRLPHPEYVAWKEQLAALVRHDVRPTERDHPLYYFTWPSAHIGALIKAAHMFDGFHVAGFGDAAQLFKFAVLAAREMLADVASLPGVQIHEPVKVRFYCLAKGATWQITAAPMAPSVISLEQFIRRGGGHRLAKLLGLPDVFFDVLYDSREGVARDEIVYYFASRAISAVLLSRLLERIVRLLPARTQLSSLRPGEVDGIVDYQFPDCYERFHASVYDRLDSIVAGQAQDEPGLFTHTKHPCELPLFEDRDPLLPDSYRILALLSAKQDPAVFAADSWQPSPGQHPGLTYEELLRAYPFPAFVSRSLDDLLEDGLLRGVDRAIEPGRYGRVFLPGGEYKAVEVSRLADLIRSPLRTYEYNEDSDLDELY